MHRRKEKSKFFKPSTLVAIFIALIMISGGMGYIFGDDNTLRYNDHKFKRTDRGYSLEINDNKVFFSYLPGDVEEIELDAAAKDIIQNSKALYVTYDPYTKLNVTMAQIQYDMEKLIYPVTGIYLERGLVNSSGYDILEVNCDNATAYMPVIEIKESNETVIVSEGNCLFIQAKTQSELVRAYNRFLYSAYGIIE